MVHPFSKFIRPCLPFPSNHSQSILNTSRVEGGTDMKKRGKEADHAIKKDQETKKKIRGKMVIKRKERVKG